MISLGFVGDIMLSRNIGVKIEKGEVKFLESLKSILKEVDILCGNLESPISDTATKIGAFRAPKKSIEIIKDFQILNLANNHIYDCGSEGIRDTLNTLKEYKILSVGVGKSFLEAYNAAIVEVKGQKIAFLGCMIPEIFYDISRISDGEYSIATLGPIIEIAIEELKGKVDFTVILVHGGNEFISFPPPSLKLALKNLLLKGADLIVTHHPHVLGGYQIIKMNGRKKLIWYSLGDFIFDSLVDERRKTGVLVVKINKNLIESFDFIPLYIKENYLLEMADYSLSQHILGKIKYVSAVLNRKDYENIYNVLYIKEFINFQKGKFYSVLKKHGYIYFIYFTIRSFKFIFNYLRKFLRGEHR